MDKTKYRVALLSALSVNPNITPEEVYNSTKETLLQEGFSVEDSLEIADDLYHLSSHYSENHEDLMNDQELYAEGGIFSKAKKTIGSGFSKAKKAIGSGLSTGANKVFNLKDKSNFKKNFMTKKKGFMGIKGGFKGVKNWAKDNKGAAAMVGTGVAAAGLGYLAYRGMKKRKANKAAQQPQPLQRPMSPQAPNY